MSSARLMQMGIIPAMTHTASEEIVLYALAGCEPERTVQFPLVSFRFQRGTPCRNSVPQYLGPPTFGIIFATALPALVAFLQA